MANRWEKHRIVERDPTEASIARERGERPGPEHTVVDGVVSAGDEGGHRSGRGRGDDRVLLAGGRQPRLDTAVAQETEEVVAGDHHAHR